jgi:hypothetical protein
MAIKKTGIIYVAKKSKNSSSLKSKTIGNQVKIWLSPVFYREQPGLNELG